MHALLCQSIHPTTIVSGCAFWGTKSTSRGLSQSHEGYHSHKDYEVCIRTRIEIVTLRGNLAVDLFLSASEGFHLLGNEAFEVVHFFFEKGINTFPLLYIFGISSTLV